jgi:hypothetical protein
MTERLDELERRIRDILEDDVVPTDIHREAVARMNEHEELRQELQRPAAFRKFLQSYVSGARDDYRTGERATPLCGCNHAACELKRGIVPGLVRRADDLDHGIDDYQAQHPEAIILVEAREEWTRRHAEYRSALRSVKLRLREGLEQTAGSARPEAD